MDHVLFNPEEHDGLFEVAILAILVRILETPKELIMVLQQFCRLIKDFWKMFN